jgi:hypothetical protein
MSYLNGGRIITDGLVYCVDAANTKSAVSGSTSWVDLSGYGNHLVASNLTTTTLISGKTASYQLLNLTDYTDNFSKSIVSSSILQVSASYTVESFCSAASSSNGDSVFSIIRIGTGADVIVMFALTPNNATSTIVGFSAQWHNNGFRSANSSTTSIPFNQFNHYVITNSFGIYKFYLNGVLLNTTDNTSLSYAYSSVSATNVRIGGSDSNLQDFSGKIGLIRVYRRPLSDSEVMQNYNASKARFL